MIGRDLARKLQGVTCEKCDIFGHWRRKFQDIPRILDAKGVGDWQQTANLKQSQALGASEVKNRQ
jgi:hypothetical protein